MNSEVLSLLRMMAPTLMLILSFILVIILSLINYKKHELTKTSTLIFILLGFVLAFGGARLMAEFYSAVALSRGGSATRLALFGSLATVPIFVPIALLAGKSWRGVGDLFGPGVFLTLTLEKVGCFIAGCCAGIECDFGIYNKTYDKVMFPVQLFEAISMVLLVIFGYWYNYKYKKKITGATFLVMATIYTVMRFFWEFFRYYPTEELRNVAFGMTFWQLWCIGLFLFFGRSIFIAKSKRFYEWEVGHYERHAVRLASIKSKILAKIKPEKATADQEA